MATSGAVLNLANLALQDVGGGRGGLLNTSTADLSSPGTDNLVTIVGNSFDAVMKRALSKGTWQSIEILKKLTQGSAPAFGWDYSYDYPDDTTVLALRVNQVKLDQLDFVDFGETLPMEVSGNLILTNATEVWIKYNSYPNYSHASSNSGAWNAYIGKLTPNLYTYCQKSLSHEWAELLSGSAALKQRLKEEMKEAYNEAVIENRRLKPSQLIRSTASLRSRRHSGRLSYHNGKQ